MRASPGGYHFKRFPSEENREESQLKGANKVECKKWSAKGTYRKASAERHSKTHLNTLVGLRPRADSKRKRAFRRALGKIYRRAASFCCFLVRRFVVFVVSSFVVSWCCRFTDELHHQSTKKSTKIHQQSVQNLSTCIPNGSIIYT